MKSAETRTPEQRKLNLGCGTRYHREWVNIDFVSQSKYVINHNLLSRLPFKEGTFTVVYSSHALEHFTPIDAEKLLRECFRVMSGGALIRIVVPDLEALARTYLKALNECSDDAQSVAMHEWSIIQLIDQCTRDTSGGQMMSFLRCVESDYADAIAQTSRTAREVLQKRLVNNAKAPSSCDEPSIACKRDGNFGDLLLRVARKVSRLVGLHKPVSFDKTGERHKWMYDKKSLSRLLLRCGFRETRVADAWSSRHPDWCSVGLDTDPDGSIYRPDSLFVEAIK